MLIMIMISHLSSLEIYGKINSKFQQFFCFIRISSALQSQRKYKAVTNLNILRFKSLEMKYIFRSKYCDGKQFSYTNKGQ